MKDWIRNRLVSLIAKIWQLKRADCPQCGSRLINWTYTEEGHVFPDIYGFLCQDCWIWWRDEGDDWVAVNVTLTVDGKKIA